MLHSMGLQSDTTQLLNSNNKVMHSIYVPCPPRVDSLEKTLMLGGIGGRRRRG